MIEFYKVETTYKTTKYTKEFSKDKEAEAREYFEKQVQESYADIVTLHYKASDVLGDYRRCKN